MTAIPERRCDACVHWERLNTSQSGRCFGVPPALQTPDSYGAFPTTEQADRCPLWKAIPATKEAG